jgi:asparagine synthase (glutamine-hydrolysing)
VCGITGFLNFSNNGADAAEQLQRMVSILHHRGPDECGMYLDDCIALGHARLSIIDLSTGQQPLHNEDQTLWIVFNGEIFNYPELRKDLEVSGHCFYTRSDTEVLLHLYEEKGVSCLQELNGQFAFAIWDSKKKRLFLARDRVGIRPLHYTFHNSSFYFASEIKSIFASNKVPREINPYALEQIFTLWTPLPGKTVFQHISELKPGHYAVVSEGSFAENKYWDIPYYPPDDQLTDNPQELSQAVGDLLKDAVRIQLRSDVPVGTYLSGGLDSSGISALVAKHFNADVRTFGIRFEEPNFDEGVFQQQMSSFLQVKHSELFVSNDDIAHAFSRLIWSCEKPLLRTAPAPLFLLSGFVRASGLKVVLTGEGADEIFGGYDIFKEALLRRFLARQPQSAFRRLPFEYLYPDIFKSERARKSLALFFGASPNAEQNPFFSHSVRWGNTSRSKVFFSTGLRQAIGDYNVYDDLKSLLPDDFTQRDCLAKAQYLEMIIFLSNYLLSSQGDRVAMAHSLEIRVPFLDHRMIEFMAKVPPVWKILGLNEKFLLKKYFRGILPEIIVRRTKHPYRAPIQQSLCASSARDNIKAHLSEDALKQSDLFDPARVKHLLNKMYMNKSLSEVDGMALAGIYSSQLLYSQYIENWPAISNGHIEPAVLIDKRNAYRSLMTWNV